MGKTKTKHATKKRHQTPAFSTPKEWKSMGHGLLIQESILAMSTAYFPNLKQTAAVHIDLTCHHLSTPRKCLQTI